MKKLIVFFVVLVSQAYAMEFAGFGSVYHFIQNQDYSNADRERSHDFHNYSKIGLNVAGALSNRARAHAQFKASGEDSSGSFTMDRWGLTSDFAFIDLEVTSNWFVRFGRQAFPIWLSSEYRDIGVEQPFVEQPAVTLSLSSFKSFNGLSTSYHVQQFLGGRLSAKIFAGGEKTDTSSISQESEQNFKNIYGANIKWEGDNFNFNTSFYRMDISITGGGGGAPTPLQTLNVSGAKVFSIGMSYYFNHLMLASEYGYLEFDVTGQSFNTTKHHGAYLLIGVPIKKIMPRYSLGWSAVGRDSAHVNARFLHTLGLNYNYASDIIFKFEYHKGWQHDVTYTTSMENWFCGVDFVF